MKKSRQIKPIHILIVFVFLNLAIGIIIAPDYGISTDEKIEYRRSELAKDIYTFRITENHIAAYDEIEEAKFYGTASSVIIRFVETLFDSSELISLNIVAHYSYFVFYQAAIIAMFLLGKQFFNDWIALGIALIFGTQPLLFGHAFINSKDIPLMTVFLFSLVVGFQMVDKWIQNPPWEKPSPKHGNPKKAALFILILLALFIAFWFFNWISTQFSAIVEYSYNTKESSLLGNLFESVTTSGSLEGYRSLAYLQSLRVLRWLVFSSPLVLLILFYVAKKNQLFGGYVDLTMLAAAAVLGFAIGTRVIAIAAAGMIGIYALVKLRKKAIIPLIIYTITSSIITFITWPYLWFFGFKGLLDSLLVFLDFPKIEQVQFEGTLYLPNDLPARYLPKLMLLQFTEPLVILAILGSLFGLYLAYKKKINITKLLLLYAWLVLPILYSSIAGMARYSNFRQYLFVTPPLFIFAGLVIRQISSRLKEQAWGLIICLIIIIPSVFSIIQLHPYQYIYYNEFTGGVDGAFRIYELDYWMTSYKEAMDYVNEHIPPGSKIIVWFNERRAAVYAENNYSFIGENDIYHGEFTNYDYAIISTRIFLDQTKSVDGPVLYSIDVGNATLSFIKKINHDED